MKIVVSTVCFFCCFSALLHGNSEFSQQVIDNQEFCVQEYSEGKVYLNCDRMFINEGKLFFRINDHEATIIPVLFSDEKGSYVLPGPDQFMPLVQCPYCKEWYHPQMDHHCSAK